METEIINRPKDDFLIMRAMSAFMRDGGEPTPSMKDSNVLELHGKLWVELRCEEGSLLGIYKYNLASGKLRKQ